MMIVVPLAFFTLYFIVIYALHHNDQRIQASRKRYIIIYFYIESYMK